MDYDHEYRWQAEDRITPAVKFPVRVPGLYPAARAYLESRELNADAAFRFGWYPAYYRGPRIIIPCTRNDGLFWQGRLLDNVADDKDNLKRWDSPFGYRGDAIVVLEEGGTGRTLVIVEGPMDALAVSDIGYPSIAVLGVQPSIPVLKHVAGIARKYKDVVLLADKDGLGEWARWQIFLGKLGVHGELVEPWSGYKDIAAMPKEMRERFLEDNVS